MLLCAFTARRVNGPKKGKDMITNQNNSFPPLVSLARYGEENSENQLGVFKNIEQSELGLKQATIANTRSGIYFVFFKRKQSGSATHLYVGQGENVFERLRNI